MEKSQQSQQPMESHANVNEGDRSRPQMKFNKNKSTIEPEYIAYIGVARCTKSNNTFELSQDVRI
jgi:hypothetical protein